MLKFKNVHIYCNLANTLDFNVIVPGIQKYFTYIPIDVRHPFLNNIDNVLAESLVSIRISDIKKPFNEQPRINIQGKCMQILLLNHKLYFLIFEFIYLVILSSNRLAASSIIQMMILQIFFSLLRNNRSLLMY
jgi:hypothetical protein